jgi:hypothetical protein
LKPFERIGSRGRGDEECRQWTEGTRIGSAGFQSVADWAAGFGAWGFGFDSADVLLHEPSRASPTWRAQCEALLPKHCGWRAGDKREHPAKCIFRFWRGLGRVASLLSERRKGDKQQGLSAVSPKILFMGHFAALVESTRASTHPDRVIRVLCAGTFLKEYLGGEISITARLCWFSVK